MATFNFELLDLPPEAEKLRGEVREFLRETVGEGAPHKRERTWGGHDREFSLKVGARGWIGMLWPKKYGGHERSALERYVVLEEMLAAGAPVSAHWVADRQSGPLLLRFGTEEQRQRFLPRIARGELAFAIGMSEPDSGSDLASHPHPRRARGGRLQGQRHQGVDEQCPHLRVHDRALPHQGRARQEARGALAVPRRHQDARGSASGPSSTSRASITSTRWSSRTPSCPRTCGSGEEGAGWKQVTTELAFERSGPERYLSSLRLIIETIREVGAEPGERAAVTIGRLVAHLATLRQMSLSVAGMLQAGQNPNLEASVVKDVGTSFEQEIPETIHSLLGVEPRLGSGSDFERTLGFLTEHAPSFSLRGGTREVLRGIIARGLGLR